jgi:hypothetical protein
MAEPNAAVAGDFVAEFRRSVRMAIQNTEREQVLEVLAEATRIRIDFDMVRRVFDTISDCPNLVERNLDVIGLPHAPATWIEIDDRARREMAPDMAAAPSRIGFLISRHPADPGVLIAAIARQIPDRADGACHLMPAFCAINLASLTDLSMRARSYLSSVPQESVARMVMHLRTYVPPGFTPEIDEFAKVSSNVDSDALHTESRLETAGEGVFLLALLVALSASNVVFSDAADGIRTASVAPRRHGRGRRMLAALRLKVMGPVDRNYLGGRPVVSLIDA